MCNLVLKADVELIILQTGTLPFSFLKSRIEHELATIENEGILIKIDFS